MSVIQNSFITNQEKFLSDIINGILPKCSSVDIWGGYFYYSGFDLICKNIKDKGIRILVGLDANIQIVNNLKKVDRFLKLCGLTYNGVLTIDSKPQSQNNSTNNKY